MTFLSVILQLLQEEHSFLKYGDELGCLEGSEDGSWVGCKEGFMEGSEKGCDEGSEEGPVRAHPCNGQFVNESEATNRFDNPLHLMQFNDLQL